MCALPRSICPASGAVGNSTPFAGTERSVAEYLIAEVLDRNTPATREFLVRTQCV